MDKAQWWIPQSPKEAPADRVEPRGEADVDQPLRERHLMTYRRAMALAAVLSAAGLVLGVISGVLGSGWTTAANGLAVLVMTLSSLLLRLNEKPSAHVSRRRLTTILLLLAAAFVACVGAFLGSPRLLSRLGLAGVATALLLFGVAALVARRERPLSTPA
jgi:hypothetical protein